MNIHAKLADINLLIVVNVKPEKAFVLFTESMGSWWPKGQTVGASPHEDIVIEPRVSGRWFERGEDGAETNWGRVLAWNAPKSVLLAWQLTASFQYDEKFETEVEIRFGPEGTQQTRITLIHRNLERFGEGADKLAASLDKGWCGFLKMFGEFAEKNAD